MELFYFIFREVFYRPLFNLLIIFYQYTPPFDLGIAIFILAILIRLFLWPITSKAIKDREEMTRKTKEFQEELKKIKKRYKDNSVVQREEILKLWREKKINPFSNFVPLIIQIIIFITFYRVLTSIISAPDFSSLYGFISQPAEIDPFFLNLIDLSQKNKVLAFLTGFFQYLYSKIAFSSNRKPVLENKGTFQEGFQKTIQTQMSYFMPIMIFFFALALPAVIAFYWTISLLFEILQYKIIKKKTI